MLRALATNKNVQVLLYKRECTVWPGMTEEKLDPESGKASIGRIGGLFLASFAILGGGLWLFRQPIAETIARGICEDQGLACKLSITRLDFGGLTLTGVDARAPGAADAAVNARELTIGLAWDGPFSPRVSAVDGDALSVRLDLTGRRSIFGDLEKAVATFASPGDQPPGPAPRIAIAGVTLIGETLSGPVTATGRITPEDDGAFTLALDATPASFGIGGGAVDLNAASLRVRVAGEDISGALKLDLERFAAEGLSLSGVAVDATLRRSAGRLVGQGEVRLARLVAREGVVAEATLDVDLDAPAPGDEPFDLEAWLARLQRFGMKAATGAVAFAGVEWKASTASMLLQPEGAGAAGDFAVALQDLNAPQASAGAAEISGRVRIADNQVAIVNGAAQTRAGVLSSPQRAALADAVAGPLEAVLPGHAAALRRAIDRAGQSFAVRAPWSARLADGVMQVSLLSGAGFDSTSGASLKATAPAGKDVIGAFSLPDYAWSAGGRLVLRGGGAPPLTVELARASGDIERLAMSGAVALEAWKVGDGVVSGNLADLDLSTRGASGEASGRLGVRLDGALGGGVWTAARGTAQVGARWDGGSFIADAPQGAVIQWSRAAYGDTVFGAGSLRYTPVGHLAERSGDGLVGRGRLAGLSLPVEGDGFGARLDLGPAAIDWRTQGGFRASFDVDPSAIELRLDARGTTVPVRMPDLKGELALGRGWKVAGRVSGVSADVDEGRVTDLAADFDLGGQGNALSGAITGLSMSLADPLTEGRRYEPLDFHGEARLASGVASFDGTFALKKSGVQVAHVAGQHNLASGVGSLAFDPTPLIFVPRRFQPGDISPLLVGPANVAGRVDVSGKASWTPQDFTASGVLDLKKLGFALASAGVFEGVSGHIEVADLLNMRSLPGQRITIDKVTLGLPIENGVIDFQLVGYDAIQLESARWPFAGGFIRVDASVFRFASASENRIVARADNWDLAVLADQLKLPDIKLGGVVAGEFPIVFRTGSAAIDKAVLKSTRPGVIQYTGDAGDAAGQANEYSKMAFDALKDFRYEVLQLGLDGDLAGQMMLTLGVRGSNPDVLDGAPFQLNIGIDSALVPLLTSTFQRPDIRTAIEQAGPGEGAQQ